MYQQTTMLTVVYDRGELGIQSNQQLMSHEQTTSSFTHRHILTALSWSDDTSTWSIFQESLIIQIDTPSVYTLPLEQLDSPRRYHRSHALYIV